MTSLAVRNQGALSTRAVETILSYLINPESPYSPESTEKIRTLVEFIFANYAPKTVFYLPLPGKPNPQLSLDPLLRTPRPRVLQQAQKESTCMFYAIQKIRMRVGKQPGEQFKALRDIERSFSAWRKEKSKIDKLFEPILDFTQTKFPGRGRVTKKNIAALLKEMDKHFSEEIRKKARALYKEFNQSDCVDFFEFIKANYYLKLIANDALYLSYNGISLKNTYSRKLKLIYSLDWEDLPLDTKEIILSNYIFRFTCQKFELQHSSWNPQNSINDLGKQVELHGPHLVLGQFGEGFYEKSPFKLKETLEGRRIYAWQPNAKRIDTDLLTHAVVLVGVDCDRERVYFIDPNNPSDPNQPMQEKIYAISYKNLRTNIFSLEGIQIKTKKGGYVFSSDPYAIYGDPRLARL